MLTVAHMNIEMKPRLGRYHHWFLGVDLLDSIWVVANSHCLADVSNMDQLWFNRFTMCFPVFSPFFPGQKPSSLAIVDPLVN